MSKMSLYRNNLPQLADRLFLTDSGLETMLIFHEGYELNQFASFELLKTESGRRRLLDYYRQHASTAAAAGMGFILETPTWRSNADWGAEARLFRRGARRAQPAVDHADARGARRACDAGMSRW